MRACDFEDMWSGYGYQSLGKAHTQTQMMGQIAAQAWGSGARAGHACFALKTPLKTRLSVGTAKNIISAKR